MPGAARVFVWLLQVATGALIGAMAGGRGGALAGVLLVLVALLLIEGRRAARLLAWLHDPAGKPPVGDPLWQEFNLMLSRQRRQHAAELARLEAEVGRFEAAGQAIPDGVVALDPDLRIRWVNRLGARHFRLDPRSDRGNLLTHLVRDPQFSAFMTRGDFAEPLLLHPTHQPGLALQVFVVEFGDAQRLIVSRDVSDREQVERMRRDFVANVSHELRTPITVVSGFVETLAELDPDEATAALANVLPLLQKQMKRMQSLVADLLTLARLESTPEPPPMKPVDLPALLTGMVADARAVNGDLHPIHCAADPGLDLRGTPGEIRSIAGNLLNNALRYSPEGSRVEVTWQRATDARGQVVGVLAVRDEGPGIAAEHLPRLTERFYRVDSGRSRDTGGTGLGLAIVKHALTRHGGHLEIESEVGRGSEFRAVFPAERLVSNPTGP
ncbi:MAG: phosphate regulon sensor histidine kinase PhoR [Rhodocyclaceae bacterium]|nr:phosphate regulon sensor histidine kinase PhoR [Rhodocyclaceae bacterium]